MPFKKGNKHGRHGKQPGAGRPTKAELDAREAKLNVWEAAIIKEEEKLANHWIKEAFKDNSVLKDIRKVRIPDARQEIDIQTHGTVIVKTNVDPHANRRKRENQR